jgi:endonuclease/exonuclease/phosphatase family metal-dependent hydrolase
MDWLPTYDTNKMERAKEIAENLPENIDILVLCEAFAGTATNDLINRLKSKGLKYQTPLLRSSSFLKLSDGGVVVLSRFPVEKTQMCFYGSACAESDRFADKGIVHITFRAGDSSQRAHLFATHTQAWDACEDVRRKQLEILKAFIDNERIPEQEIVFVVGDLNVPRNVPSSYEFLLQTLNCTNLNSTDLTNPSYSPKTNALARISAEGDPKEVNYDYILLLNNHLTPKGTDIQVQQLKAQVPYEIKGKGLFSDLSDHYPLFGRFAI